MKGSQLLRNARGLVEQGWCQGTEARDEAGYATHAGAPTAASWSLLGALQAQATADPSTRLQDIGDAVAALAELIVDPSLANWNDSAARTKLDVMRVLREAEALVLDQLVYHTYSTN